MTPPDNITVGQECGISTGIGGIYTIVHVSKLTKTQIVVDCVGYERRFNREYLNECGKSRFGSPKIVFDPDAIARYRKKEKTIPISMVKPEDWNKLSDFKIDQITSWLVEAGVMK